MNRTPVAMGIRSSRLLSVVIIPGSMPREAGRGTGRRLPLKPSWEQVSRASVRHRFSAKSLLNVAAAFGNSVRSGLPFSSAPGDN